MSAGKGGSRRAKMDRRKKRQDRKRDSKVRAGARRETEDKKDEDLDRASLEPLGPLVAAADGPLAALRFDLGALPAEAPGKDAGGEVAGWFLSHLPGLADAAWRERARAALGRVEAEARAAELPESHPDRHAIEEASFWLGEEVGSGPPALENTLFRFLFERSVEAAAIAGRLPAWVAQAFDLDAEGAGQRLHEARRDRIALRIAVGPFEHGLTVDDIPSAASMISRADLKSEEFTSLVFEAAEQDLTPERRAALARRLRDAAAREEAESRPLAAFDLGTLAAALGSEDPVDQGLARLYYAQSVYKRREDAAASDSEWPET